MITKMLFNSDYGWTIKLEAECKAEQAALDLLYGFRNISIDRDHSIHESYSRSKYVEITGKLEDS